MSSSDPDLMLADGSLSRIAINEMVDSMVEAKVKRMLEKQRDSEATSEAPSAEGGTPQEDNSRSDRLLLRSLSTGAPPSSPSKRTTVVLSGDETIHLDNEVLNVLNDWSVTNFDPRRWIVAAGQMQKRRDGKMREGFANRFFVLTDSTLFYYRIPKRGNKGDLTNLLGEERGLIRLSEVSHVKTGSQNGWWYLHFTFGQGSLKKTFGSSAFGPSVNLMVLRVRDKATCVYWETALNSVITRRLRDRDPYGDSSSSPKNELAGVMNTEDLAMLSPLSGDYSNLDQTAGGQEGDSDVSRAEPMRRAVSDVITPGRPTHQLHQMHNEYHSDTLSGPETPVGTESWEMPSNSSIPESRALLSPPSMPGGQRAVSASSMSATTVMAVERLSRVQKPRLVDPEHLNYLQGIAAFAVLVGILFSESSGLNTHLAGFIIALFFLACYMIEKRANAHQELVRSVRQYTRNMDAAMEQLKQCTLDDLEEDMVERRPAAVARGTPTTLSTAQEAPSVDKSAPAPLPPGVLFRAGVTTEASSPGGGCMAGNMVWSNGNGRNFNVRIGPNYSKNKQKSPSADALYECVGFDVIKGSKAKLSHIASRIQLPGPRACDDLDKIRRSGLPRLFVVNMQVPLKQPSVFGKDEPEVSSIMYFAVKPETVEAALHLDSASPGVKLCARFCSEWETNEDIRRRFKGIGIADNLEEMGQSIAYMAGGYNGKPVIIYKSGDIHQGKDYIEVDVGVHLFNYACRAAINKLKHKVPDLIIKGGFVIQAEDDEELPEIMLGCVNIEKMDFLKGVDLSSL